MIQLPELSRLSENLINRQPDSATPGPAEIEGTRWTMSSLGLFRNQRGATAIEYGLIAALIAVAIIVALTQLGLSLSDVFNNVAGNL